MKQVASYLAMPIFVVDPDGNLLYFNEPAESMLGLRYDETGELPMSEWSTIFTPTDEHGAPIPPSRTAARRVRSRSGDRRTARWGSRGSTASTVTSP